jgi:hypothetical protein
VINDRETLKEEGHQKTRTLDKEEEIGRSEKLKKIVINRKIQKNTTGGGWGSQRQVLLCGKNTMCTAKRQKEHNNVE